MNRACFRIATLMIPLALASCLDDSSDGAQPITDDPNTNPQEEQSVVGTWKIAAPQGTAEVGDKKKSTELTFYTNDTYRACVLGYSSWDGQSWVFTSYEPCNESSGSWHLLANNYLLIADTGTDGYTDSTVLRYTITGDTLQTTMTEYFLGSLLYDSELLQYQGYGDGILVGLTLTSNGLWIQHNYSYGILEYSDTTTYDKINDSTLVVYGDTIRKESVPGGFAFWSVNNASTTTWVRD